MLPLKNTITTIVYENLLSRNLTVLCLALALSACSATVKLPGPVKKNNSSKAQPRNVIKEAPKADKTKIHAKLARGYLQQKQYAIAKTELDKVLRMEPDHSEGNYVMALLMMELDQFDKAEKHFEKAVKSDKENSAAAHDFGMFLCQTGQERRSISYFETAVSNPLFARSELSYMRAGECLAKIGDPEAEKYLKGALTKNAKLRPALYRLASIKYEQKSYLLARAYIERYLAITKPQPASLFLAYQIESKLKAKDVADKYRLTLLEEFPGSKQANSLRGQVQQ